MPSAAAAARTEATSETSAWKARLAEKYAAAAAGEAGGVRSTGLTCGVVVMMSKLGPTGTPLKGETTEVGCSGRGIPGVRAGTAGISCTETPAPLPCHMDGLRSVMEA